MAFISFAFAIFCLCVIIPYFIVPLKYRWIVLLIGSYAFFYINSQWLVLVMFVTTAITFFMGRMIHKCIQAGKDEIEAHPEWKMKEKKACKNEAKKKAGVYLKAGIILDLGILLYLKYFNFFADSFNSVFVFTGIQIPFKTLLIPIGISFYTLQAISYLIDVSRDKCEADTNFAKFMLYMSFFPQIVQGPIARHNHLAHQLYEGHQFDLNRTIMGLQMIMWGFLKKAVIADRVAIPVNAIFDHYTRYSGPIVLLAAFLYGIQVYTDFSGGMDIARGVAQILGIDLELNFNQPYFSKSIEEFWRRWHITLGGWMRDYIFYPLSLSKAFTNLGRKSRKYLGSFIGKRLPPFLSMFIVYFLVGLWHGSETKYIAYGLWNGIFVMSGVLLAETYVAMRERLHIPENAGWWRIFQMVRTALLCSIGRFFPRAGSTMVALKMIASIFAGALNWKPIFDGTLLKLDLSLKNWIVLIIAIIVLFVVDYLHEKGISIREVIARQHIVVRYAAYYGAIIIFFVFGIYGPAFDSAAFIYEQF